MREFLYRWSEHARDMQFSTSDLNGHMTIQMGSKPQITTGVLVDNGVKCSLATRMY
jgi:hypothetical protein